MIKNTIAVKEKRAETALSCSLMFEIPDNIKQNMVYIAGQYTTLEVKIDGENHRRAYSICTAPHEKDFGVTIKRIDKGLVSNFLNDKILGGSPVTVFAPQGDFVVPQKCDHLFLFAAGSGITPLFSIIKDQLNSGAGNISLFYGNSSKEEVIYFDQLKAMEAISNGRLRVFYYFSKEKVEQASPGRITPENLKTFETSLFGEKERDKHYFICGPEQMIDSLHDYFVANKIAEDNIHFEKFFSAAAESQVNEGENFVAKAKVILDDEEITVAIKSDQTVINALLDIGIDAPYSCNEGNCSSCIAKIIEGRVEMQKCESLDEDEIEDGYILACQSYPKTTDLLITFDE